MAAQIGAGFVGRLFATFILQGGMRCTRISTPEGRSNTDAARITNGGVSPEAERRRKKAPALQPGFFAREDVR